MEYRVEVFKVTAWKNGCVYKTKKVKDLWLPVECRTIEECNLIAQRHGGDHLAFTCDYR